MSFIQIFMRGPSSPALATNRHSARRVRRLAGGALNFFALILVVNQLWPGLPA